MGAPRSATITVWAPRVAAPSGRPGSRQAPRSPRPHGKPQRATRAPRPALATYLEPGRHHRAAAGRSFGCGERTAARLHHTRQTAATPRALHAGRGGDRGPGRGARGGGGGARGPGKGLGTRRGSGARGLGGGWRERARSGRGALEGLVEPRARRIWMEAAWCAQGRGQGRGCLSGVGLAGARVAWAGVNPVGAGTACSFCRVWRAESASLAVSIYLCASGRAV